MPEKMRNRRKRVPAGKLTVANILRRAQALVRQYIPGDDVDLTEELLQDRRREAAQEAPLPNT